MYTLAVTATTHVSRGDFGGTHLGDRRDVSRAGDAVLAGPGEECCGESPMTGGEGRPNRSPQRPALLLGGVRSPIYPDPHVLDVRFGGQVSDPSIS